MFDHTIQATIYYYYRYYFEEFKNIENIAKFVQKLYLEDTIIIFCNSIFFSKNKLKEGKKI